MRYLVTKEQRLFESNEYKTVSVKEALEILNAQESYLGVDTETEGFDVYTKNLLLLQIGNADVQVAVDCTTTDSKEFKSLLERDDMTFLFHNAKFDLKFLYKQGIVPKNVYDSFLVEKLLWIGYPSGMHPLSLQALCDQYLGVHLDKSVRGEIFRGLTERVVVYGCRDVEFLVPLMKKQLEEVGKQNLRGAVTLENEFVRVLSYVEYCGIKLDTEKWKQKMDDDLKALTAAKTSLDSWVETHFADDPRFCKKNLQGDLFTGFDTAPRCTVNWKSPIQVASILSLLGFDLKIRDKTTGEIKNSIEAKIIERQKTKSEISGPYLVYATQKKVVDTYGQSWIDQINPVTGRIHTQFQQLGADTGRLSSGGKDKQNHLEYVNFQNLPSDERTRSCFIAEPGNKMICCDYSGQESMILANFSQDPTMLHELSKPDGDMHSVVAKLVFAKEIGDTPTNQVKAKFKRLRQEAKGYEFLVAYGGDAHTIMMNYGKSKEEADRIYNSYMNGLSGVKKYQTFRRKDVMEKGYILINNIIGRRAHIYDYDTFLKPQMAKQSEPGFWDTYKELKQSSPECTTVQDVKAFFKRKTASEKQSINYCIQGTGADMIKLAMIRLFNWILDNDLFEKVKIVNLIHDECTVECPDELAEQVSSKVQECMESAGDIFCTIVPIKADPVISPCWVH